MGLGSDINGGMSAYAAVWRGDQTPWSLGVRQCHQNEPHHGFIVLAVGPSTLEADQPKTARWLL